GGMSLEDRASRPASKEIIRALERVDPEASGGVGDFAAAFRVLNGLAMFDMLATLEELKSLGELPLLQQNLSAAVGVNRQRIEVAAAAVGDRGMITTEALASAQGDAFSNLAPEQQADIDNFLGAAAPKPAVGPETATPPLAQQSSAAASPPASSPVPPAYTSGGPPTLVGAQSQ